MNKQDFCYFKPLQLIMPMTTALSVLASGCNYAQAVTFNFFPSEDTSQEVLDAFNIAGGLWSQYLHDDVTINVGIGLETLPENVIGGANPNMVRVQYTDVVNQLIQDETSRDDFQGINYLPTSSEDTINRLINHTNSWHGFTHTDDSIGNLWMTSANAKALGIIDSDDLTIDGFITLSDSFKWDFNRDDGIDYNAFDAISTATHEIGHLLGFISGSDLHNMVSPVFVESFFESLFTESGGQTNADYNFITPLDLYRHSSRTREINSSLVDNYVVDWRTDFSWLEQWLGLNQAYFSLDGGQTNLANFAKGVSQDGYQTSHFQDNGAGVMAPTLKPGKIKHISPLDLQMLDVIGWDTQRLANTDYENGMVKYSEAAGGELYRLSWGRGSSGTRSYSFRQIADYHPSNGESNATTTVPEPTMTISLLGLNLLGIGALGKRDRKKLKSISLSKIGISKLILIVVQLKKI